MSPDQPSTMRKHDEKGPNVQRHLVTNLKMTDGLLKKIIDEYVNKDVSITDLSRKYDVDKKTISRWFRKSDVALKPNKKHESIKVERVKWHTKEERDEEILRQYNGTDRGCNVIARSLGIGKRTVFRVLDDHNVARHKKHQTVIDLEALKKEYEDGCGVVELARKYDTTSRTIHDRLTKIGCILRTSADTNSAIPINLQDDVIKWYVDEDHSTYDVAKRLKNYNVDVHPNSIQKFINRRGLMRHGQEMRNHVARKQKNKNHRTKVEAIVEQAIKELEIKYDWQHPIDGWTYDFSCGDVLIEANGDYWHSLPGRRQRDAKKFNVAREHNKKVCYVWEHEANANVELIKNRLKHALTDKPTFDFRACTVKAVDFKDVEAFLDRHHYQGSGRNGTTCVGCYNGDELVAVVTFGSVVRLEMAEKQSMATNEIRELMRLCIRPDVQSRNFATWLLARSRRVLREMEPNVELLISFADPNFGHVGTIYKADNWRFDGETSSSYWYVDPRSTIIHKKTVWNRAMRSGITEKEQIKRDHLIKVEARPKYRFIRKP
jgi:transposase-like protein